MKLKLSWCCFQIVASLLLIGLLLGCGGCSKEARRTHYISAGDKDVASERYERAEIEYRKALQIAPRDPQAMAKLGTVYHAQGRWTEAMVWLNEAVKFQTNNVEIRIRLARCFLLMQEFRGVQAQTQAVLAQEPENMDALLLLAGALALAQDLASIEQVFAKVSAIGQKKAGYHLARGALFLHQGDFSRAEAEYRQELELYPKSGDTYQALGSLLIARDDLQQAGTSFKMAAELAPLHSSARLAYADWKLRTGKTEEAVQDIQGLLKKAPDFLPAWLFLARVAVAQGRADDATGYIQKVLARDAFNLEGLSMKGSLFLAHGDGTNAATLFERIIETYPPGPPAAHYNLATAYVISGEEAKAIRSLNKALELQPNYTDAILLLSRVNLRQGNSAAAIAALSGLVQRQPRLAQAHFDLVAAYAAAQKLDDAAASYSRMSRIFTNNAEVPYRLGTVLLMQSRTNEARAAFEQSLAIAPDLLQSSEQLVLLDLAENRGAEASERVGHLIGTYPKLPLLRVLEARIYLARASAVMAKEKHDSASGRIDFTMSSEPSVRQNVDAAEAALQKAIGLDRDYFPAHQLLASLYLNSNRAQQAADHLSAVLAHTNDLTCMMELGAVQEQLKAYPAARSTYQKVLSVEPQCVPAINNLALLLAEHLGELEQGYELAQKARKLQPGNAYVADTLGWMLYKRHDYRASLDLFQEAARQLNSEEVQSHLGLAYYMLGEEAAAQSALSGALKSPKEFLGRKEKRLALQILASEPSKADDATRALLGQRLSASADDPIALQRLAAIQSRDGQFDDSLVNYQRALKANRKNPRVLFAIAQLYAEHLNQPDRALEPAKAAHAADPEAPEISGLLGRLAYQTRDFQWASSLLQDCARKLPGDSRLCYDLAWSYYSLGRVPEAVAAMRRVAEDEQFAKKEDAARFLEMAEAAENPADAAAQKILESQPEYVPALIVSAAAAEQRHDFPNAARFYRRALAGFPLFAPAIRNLALLEFEHLKDYAAAYNLATKAREVFPANPQIIRALALLSYRRDDFSRCAQLLSPLPLTAKDGELLSYLGLAQYKLKQTVRSKATLQQALASNLPDNLADDVKKALTELK